MAYNLSEKAIAEKYEDLLFTKVMALYAEEESEKILFEAKELSETGDKNKIQKLFDKIERSENLFVLWKYSKKIITFAAMVVFVAVISLSSVVVASAEAREAVAEAIYHLMIQDYGKYTRVTIGESTGFINPEIYTWDDAYAPTYMPEGFVFDNITTGLDSYTVEHTNEENFILIQQSNADYTSHIDTENASVVKNIIIYESEALYIEKNGLTYITWFHGDILFFVCGNIDGEEIIKVAEGIKPIEKYEAPAEEEEYTFVDPEIYTWKNAYGMTYVPEGFVFDEKKSAGEKNMIIYKNSETNIIFSQSGSSTLVARIDTENANIVKDLIIGESSAVFVVKDGFTTIAWNIGNTFFSIRSYIDSDEVIKIAEGIKPIN